MISKVFSYHDINLNNFSSQVDKDETHITKELNENSSSQSEEDESQALRMKSIDDLDEYYHYKSKRR